MSLALSLCPEVPASPSLQLLAPLGCELPEGEGLSTGQLSSGDPSTPERESSRPTQGSLRDERTLGDTPRLPVPLSEVEVGGPLYYAFFPEVRVAALRMPTAPFRIDKSRALRANPQAPSHPER